MDIKNKDRATLKSYFLKNKIPTESNFAELIDGMLNQKDDGIAKLPGDPLSIAAAGDGSTPQKLVHFYGNLADANPAWLLQMNPRSDQNNPATAKAGFSISDGTGSSRLFIDKASGSLGIGTTAPSYKFHVVTADKSVGLLESTSTEAYLNFSTSEGRKNLVSIGNRPGGRLALWTAEGGYVLNITRSGKVGIGTEDPKNKFHVVTADKSVGLLESASTEAYLNFSTSEGEQNLVSIGNRPGGRLALWTAGGGYVLNITRSGKLGIGTEDPKYQLEVKGEAYFAGKFSVKSDSGNMLVLQGDGNLVLYRSNGTAWWSSGTSVSDKSLKKDIRSIERPLEKLLAISGVSFLWTEEDFGTDRELGVVADEVEKVFPELVTSLDKKYKSVKYQGLIPVLIEAIKEQQAEILRFSAELNELREACKPGAA